MPAIPKRECANTEKRVSSGHAAISHVDATGQEATFFAGKKQHHIGNIGR